ncbi:hypothetical protein HPP92_012257 [Vanilla planifolia]|uniref:Uncharacterized protein n=1 Tax=Vanilla planifolia TaxID=51239 RepID=A0A835QZ58_VANPL|nr:hypothetical protein HPP92_012257 [Vanilla planifolia]
MEVIWDIALLETSNQNSVSRSIWITFPFQPTIQANLLEPFRPSAKTQAKKVACFYKSRTALGSQGQGREADLKQPASLLGPEAIQGLSSIHAKGNTASQKEY